MTAKRLCLVAMFLCMFPSSQALAAGKCAELLQSRCVSCHSLQKTCSELGGNKDYWQRTISAMARYSGGIGDKEVKTLVNCLAKQKKDVKALCNQ